MGLNENIERLLKAREKKPKTPYKGIRKKSLKAIASEKAERENKTDVGLDKWFEERMATSEPVCAECGMRADWLLEPQEDAKKSAAYKLMWRACQAHILPKKKTYGFPSIATNPENHIILFPSWGGHLCGCHGFYDSNWYNASTMKIWPQVLQTMKKKLLPFIAENEKKNIPEQLLTALDETP